MNIQDLKQKIDVAIELGFGDAVVCTDESRDGETSYHYIVAAEFVDVGTKQDQQKALVIR